MEKLVGNLVTNSLQQSTESYRLVFGKILFPGENFKSVLHFKIKFEVMTCALNLTRPQFTLAYFTSPETGGGGSYFSQLIRLTLVFPLLYFSMI